MPKATDIKLALTSETIKNIQAALEKRSKILGRVRSYESNTSPVKYGRNANFVTSPYELGEIARAMDVEPYIMQSIKKHRTHILKEGYEIYGTEEETVKYVNNRLYEISLVSGIPTLQWIRELITNIVAYHNGILIYRRDDTRSSGKPIRMYGKIVKPIAGIFVGDPISMGVEIDKYGTPIKWKQRVATVDGSGENLFEPEDVVHIPIDRKTGLAFGTPYLVSVLDDIRALRKLEELVLIIAEKEAFPLYHYKIGTETKPATVYDDGDDEISMVMGQLSGTPSNGYVVTSERHEISLISRDKSAFDLSPLLTYFESRVLGGLSLSSVDLGRGNTSNKGTATSMSKNLEDSAKDYQSIISAHLTQFLIVPLLLEGGFDVTLDNIVYFKFPMIDREELRAHQNHGLQLFMGNALTLQEFRKDYLNKEGQMDEMDSLMQKQLTADITLAKAVPKPATASSSKSSSVRRTVTNRSKPTNQHGSTNKSRFKKKNDYIDEIGSLLSNLKNNLINLKSDSNIDSEVSSLLITFSQQATRASTEVITETMEEGFHMAEDQFIDFNEDSDKNIQELGTRTIGRFFNNFINKSFWKVLNPYKPSIISYIKPDEDGKTSSYLLIKSFEAISSSIKSLCEDQLETARRFGFAKCAKRAGYNKIDIINNNEELVEQINIAEIIYKDLMPTEHNSNYFLRLPLENTDSE
jgi:hypothetical protein